MTTLTTFSALEGADLFLQPVVIETKPTKEGQKTRSFRADLMAVVAANKMWEYGGTQKDRTCRPVFLAYAATDQEARAFTANIRTGRPAVQERSGSGGDRWEIPRSAGFRFETFSSEGATLTLGFLPSIFALQPGTVDQTRIEFISMPPTWWVEEQAAEIRSEMGADAEDAAIAAYFVAYLDLRSPLPVANHLSFHLGLYRAAQEQPWCFAASRNERDFLYAEGVDAVGFSKPVAVQATHEQFAAFLAEYTAAHLPKDREEVISHGTPRIASPRRVLSHARRAASQLGLFG